MNTNFKFVNKATNKDIFNRIIILFSKYQNAFCMQRRKKMYFPYFTSVYLFGTKKPASPG